VVPVSVVSSVLGAETWNRFNIVNREDMLQDDMVWSWYAPPVSGSTW